MKNTKTGQRKCEKNGWPPTHRIFLDYDPYPSRFLRRSLIDLIRFAYFPIIFSSCFSSPLIPPASLYLSPSLSLLLFLSLFHTLSYTRTYNSFHFFWHTKQHQVLPKAEIARNVFTRFTWEWKPILLAYDCLSVVSNCLSLGIFGMYSVNVSSGLRLSDLGVTR